MANNIDHDARLEDVKLSTLRVIFGMVIRHVRIMTDLLAYILILTEKQGQFL